MTDPNNYPNSWGYDPSLPIGFIKWDAEDCYDGADEIETEWEEDNEALEEDE